jgi:hypothetical protein
MDEQVLRGIARWPNVPAVYGWLALDARGQWLLQGDRIDNPIVTAYIGRNYERDQGGRWFFQNGPQRVFVELAYTPFVYRVRPSEDTRLSIETHTGLPATALRGAWIDERGSLLIETGHGVGIIHDSDLDVTLPSLVGEHSAALSDDALENAMSLLQGGADAPLWLALGASNVRVEPIRCEAVPARFQFNPKPMPPSKESDIAAAR